MTIPFWQSKSAPLGVFGNLPLPHQDASLADKFMNNWIGPVMKAAWSRPIETEDLYDLTPDFQCRLLGDALEAQFMRRMPPDQRPLPYRAKNITDHVEPIKEPAKNGSSEVSPIKETYDQNLLRAMYFTIYPEWWPSLLMKLSSMCLRLLAPLLIKFLIQQISRSNSWHKAIITGISKDDLISPKPVGHMVGAAIGIWLLLLASSTILYYAWWRSRLTGKKVVSALTTMIMRKSMRLSAESKVEMTNGRITTMVSVDCSKIDQAIHTSQEIINIPIQLILGIGLLIWQIGYSGLVGLGVLLLAGPFKVWMFKHVSRLRSEQNKLVDSRVRLLSEVLNNIRAVKLYAYEGWFGRKVGSMRSSELSKFKENNLSRSTLTATMSFIPTLAAILTFITYALSGHTLDAAIIFSSLQYFMVLKGPITLAPEVLTAAGEALVGIRRINDFLTAHETKSDLTIDNEATFAIAAKGDFQYANVSTTQKSSDNTCSENKQVQTTHPVVKKGAEIELKDNTEPFALRNIDLEIPRGALVCVIGRVGTGKTTLLSGLISEVRQIDGQVLFGGSVSYVPQQAWVQSGTIRDNITFSADPACVDIARVNQIIDACGLRPDVAMWPDGDLTKIGERGITLSGGQRQRICIARAAYEESDIVLLDDPLSAVDPHVGIHILEKCILSGPMGGRTRILVTHHLDILPRADLILVMDRDEKGDGRVIQKGTYGDLLNQQGAFRALINQYGSRITSQMTSNTESDKLGEEEADDVDLEETNNQEKGMKLILEEERAEGAVSSKVYLNYLKTVRSTALITCCVIFLVSAQAAAVFNTLFLGYWSENQFGLTQGAYMGIYGGLGVSMALFTWGATYTMFLACVKASYAMFNQAWTGVMRSPITWHDRTPTGRIISRLSKDIEQLDDRLSFVWNSVFSSLLSIVGSLALILYTYPYAALTFIPTLMYIWLLITFYRRTSREIQRLASTLRSHIFTNIGEQLDGLHVIRAFRQQERFTRRLEQSVDVHFSAIMISVSKLSWTSIDDTPFEADLCEFSKSFTQSGWLGRRMSFTTQFLVLAVSIFGIIFRNSVSPAKFGVVLVYVISTTSVMNNLVRVITEAEQQMNTVERVQYYMSLPSEAATTFSTDPRDGEVWPSRGIVSFKNVQMRYRPELPLVLKEVTFDIRAGEKVGIIGRTGAGKSSLAQALFRTIEICGGKMEVDGRDISNMGLDTLRKRLSIIPQDAFLFGGSVRDNIDPTGCHSDASLNGALNLIHKSPHASVSLREKFHLDALVANEGTNFSAGERQLLALVRALVKRCKVLLLDEASSSVDSETDALIQKIIQSEFADVTLISIAHRLQTVAYYDRILVMNAGQVAEVGLILSSEAFAIRSV
ncbi:uncharacterized protein IL334_006538 [Kwoniella shivajii]|uniref:Uncharacterized protein n=1 Tax=Kwoniella shivajii TaxID=564305 RepID=A0ABZ1D678_9TREE|nr:hypothetical protein IL334_006538 [Kwoniella shivajii]